MSSEPVSRLRPFHIVDVFADQKFAGNQLAVVRNAMDFPETGYQRFAREMNFSETTFIMINENELDGRTDIPFTVRIFTPKLELPFAGHPTLGTAFVIQQYILRKKVPKIVLDLKIGPIEVTPEYESMSDGVKLLWMKQNEPKFSKTTVTSEQVSKVLGLQPGDFDATFPIQDVSTGVPFLIIPLKSMTALKKCKVDKEKYYALIRKTKAKSFLVFSPGSHGTDSQLSVRMFSDYFGVPEDPATGSGNGCLAGYLSRYKYFGSDRVDTQVDQGYEIGRPSTLFLKTSPERKAVNISVGGHVVPVAEGALL
ncbi:MAG TPA: PhzF family phenazine biosynthesis protein [Nitrososphaerales archaeon]|nr:PhzF family phenazine biosynthesis protein [Nitrososphaerales archaeon]